METQLQLFGLSVKKQQTNKKEGPRKNEVFNDYEAFVDKFVPKKTTDDCYTPQPVFDEVLRFVGTLVDLSDKKIIRPFWPGADFTIVDYPQNGIVVDNPPFSLLSRIIRFYCAHSIKFFLFAPSLSLFTARECDLTYIITDSEVVYENGAIVRTGFVTNLVPDVRIWCCPDFGVKIKEAQDIPVKKKSKIDYPDHIVTSAILQRLVHYGMELKIGKNECFPISSVGDQDLFGGGYLLSSKARAERNACERKAEKRAAELSKQGVIRIQLSDRELRIIERLDKEEPR